MCLTRKERAELDWWYWYLGEHGMGARADYYREFMMSMGNIQRQSFFSNLICLDIGCGPAGSLTWLSNSKAAIGLDPLAEHYIPLGIQDHQMIYLSGRVEKIPLPSAYVDVIFSMNSLDHVDDFEQGCREIRRVLKPGGYFIASINLNEPSKSTELGVLTEELLADRLFRGWAAEFYRVRPKVEADSKPYRYFFEDCPEEIKSAKGPRALWCRFKVPDQSPEESDQDG